METSTQFLTQEKRQEGSKDVSVQFVYEKDDFIYYNILSTDGGIKYLGRVEKTKSLSEYCTCPDFLHRNNIFYRNEHGFALQCKHIIAAKKARGWD